MKPTEVMIGDWVSYVGKDFNNFADKISGIIDGCVTFDNEMIHRSIDNIHPIQLTPEILEKIGFSKVPQTGCSNQYHWEIEKYEEETDCLLYRIKAYINPFRDMYISIDNFGDCEPISFGKQIEGLHEFQHALRLCGIEKEIVL